MLPDVDAGFERKPSLPHFCLETCTIKCVEFHLTFRAFLAVRNEGAGQIFPPNSSHARTESAAYISDGPPPM